MWEGQLNARKDSLAKGVGDLESQLDRMSRDARREKKEASRKLQEAANSIRDNRVKDKIKFSKNLDLLVVKGRVIATN